MSTQLHYPKVSMAATNTSGQGPSKTTSSAAEHPPQSRRSGAPEPSPGAQALDQILLELLVHMSLRLRLRGLDLESSTGLVGRELDLVALLTASGPTSVKSLVADLGLPRSTMIAIVDRLQERGLVIRLPNPDDRRSVILEATPEAHGALARYQAGMSGLVSHIQKVLPEAEQLELTRLVTKMADTF